MRRDFHSGARLGLAHDPSDAPEVYRRADEILVLDDGQVVARGDLRTLLAESPLFREVWRESLHASGETAVEAPRGR